LRLILTVALLTLLALSPILLVDSIIPSSSIPCDSGSVPVSGLKNSPWVYALGMSVSGYRVETVATQEGRRLVGDFIRFFNSGNWFIITIVMIVAISLVSSMLSSSVSDAIKASVFSITVIAVLGLYYINENLRPSLYNLPLDQPVIEDAFATLSLMIVVGTIINIVAVAALSGVLTYIVLLFKPRPALVTPVKPQAVEKTEAKVEEVKKEKAPPLSTPPLCPKCGSKLIWKPEESRYYCENCKAYPEDVYFKI
jgi:ribosomal protein S27AE